MHRIRRMHRIRLKIDKQIISFAVKIKGKADQTNIDRVN